MILLHRHLMHKKQCPMLGQEMQETSRAWLRTTVRKVGGVDDLHRS